MGRPASEKMFNSLPRRELRLRSVIIPATASIITVQTAIINPRFTRDWVATASLYFGGGIVNNFLTKKEAFPAMFFRPDRQGRHAGLPNRALLLNKLKKRERRVLPGRCPKDPCRLSVFQACLHL